MAFTWCSLEEFTTAHALEAQAVLGLWALFTNSSTNVFILLFNWHFLTITFNTLFYTLLHAFTAFMLLCFNLLSFYLAPSS